MEADEQRMGTVEDRVGELELRIEAFQSINIELIRLIVELGLDHARKDVLIKILREWAAQIEPTAASSGDTLGAEIQKAFIIAFEEKISKKAGRKQ